MYFPSQYSTFASHLFDGHPLGNDSRWIVTQPTGDSARPSQTIENIRSILCIRTYDSVYRGVPNFMESNSRHV